MPINGTGLSLHSNQQVAVRNATIHYTPHNNIRAACCHSLTKFVTLKSHFQPPLLGLRHRFSFTHTFPNPHQPSKLSAIVKYLFQPLRQHSLFRLWLPTKATSPSPDWPGVLWKTAFLMKQPPRTPLYRLPKTAFH